MITVTIANFLAVFISLFGRIIKRPRTAFLIAVVCLVCFYGIRTDYGNDIPVYILNFERISQYSYSEILDNNERLEPGWLVLNVFFAPFGWQIFLVFLTIIQFGTVYWLINKYVEPSKYWLVFSFYVFSSALLLTDLSMLRQALAMHVSCWSIPYVLKRDYLKSIPILLLATTFHTSAFAVFTIILLPLILSIKPKIVAIIYVSLFVLLMIADKMLGDYFEFVFQTTTFERYEVYAADKIEKGSGFGILFQLILCLWLLLRHSKQKVGYFFNLTLCLSVMMSPLSLHIPMVSRIGMYFLLMGIVSLQALTNYKKDPIGFILLLAYLFIAFSGYFAFFESPVWKHAFGTYHTVLD